MNFKEAVETHESISDTVKPKAQKLLESFRKAPLNKSKFIYHYTSASGLRGIVESNCIWATDIAYLNDKEEVDHGITERNKVLNNIVQSSRNSPEYKDFASRIGNIKGNRGDNSFVSCFTRNGDQLSQWRGYSNSVIGYSIEFDREALNQFFEESAKGRLIHFETFDDVIY